MEPTESKKLPYKLENIAQLAGHSDRAWQIAWNPVKPILASCSADKTVRMYAYGSHSSAGLQFHHLNTISTGHTKTVRAIAWAPSGKTLATGSFDSHIAIWEQDVDEEEESKAVSEAEWECMSTLEGHETECKSVAYSSSGTLLASCSRDKTVWVWEVHPDCEFDCLSVLMHHTQDVKYVAWHPTDEILASASYDDTIRLYVDDPEDDWYPFATLTGHTSTVWCLSWSPDGDYLASSSDDATIRIWKRLSENVWETVIILYGHNRAVFSLTWGKGKGNDDSLGWIASTGSDGHIFVWDILKPKSPDSGSDKPVLPTSRLLARLESAHTVHDVNCVTWCPRKGYENIFATAGDDGVVNVWKVTEV